MLPRRAQVNLGEAERHTVSVSPAPEAEELSDSEETIRRIIRVRDSTYGMQVLEQPEEEDQSSDDGHSSTKKLPWMRRSMEELVSQSTARDRSLKAQRKTLRQEVMKILTVNTDSLASISTTAATSLVNEDPVETKYAGKLPPRLALSTNHDRIKAAILSLEGRHDLLKRELLRTVSSARSGSHLVLLLRSVSSLVPEALYVATEEPLHRLSRGSVPETLRLKDVHQCYNYSGSAFVRTGQSVFEADAIVRRR